MQTRNSFRSDQAKLAEIDRQMDELAQGGILWKKPFAAESSIALTGNAVLVGGMDEVRAFDLDDGREVWTAKLDGEVRGLAVAGGRLVASTTTGSIYTFASSPPAAGAPWFAPPRRRPKHSRATAAASSMNKRLARFWPIAA